VIAKATATVTLGDLAATFDGTAKAASATTVPSGLNVSFTYDGSPTAPSAAGSYAVVAMINDASYEGTASGTLVIAKATATVTLGDLAATFDGTAKAASATTVPSGLNVSLTYDGSPTAPSAAGSYAVVAMINDANYEGTASGTLVIAKATATVTLGDLAATFDGTAKAASATTVPSGLNVSFTYDGSPTAPSAVGSYAVVATINDEDGNYEGTASGTLVISRLVIVENFLDWQFSDADGTLLNSTYNFGTRTIANLTGTRDNWSGGGMAVQGGVLNIGDTATTKWNPNKTANGGSGGAAGEATRTATLSTPLTSGQVVFEYKVANWNLGGTDGRGSPNNGVRFLVGDSESNSVSLEFEVGAVPAGSPAGTLADDIRVQSTVSGNGTIVGGAPNAASINATALAAGTVYIIATQGTTDWTLVGAANSNVGTIFTASGLGVGTGTANVLGRLPFDRLGAVNLVGSPANAVTLQLLADLDTGVWSTRARVGSSGPWLPLVTNGVGLTRIDRIQLVVDASNGAGWQHGGVDGTATEFVQIDSITLGTQEAFSKPAATVTLGNLAVDFNGSPKAATVTTVPAGLNVNLTYDGSTTVPTNAGSYLVVAKVNDATYQGTALGTLVIDKLPATATLSNLTATYDGTAKPVSVTTVPAGLKVNVTYDRSATEPTAAGSYAVVAVVDDVNYRGRFTRTLQISKASATVSLGGLEAVFDGTPKAASVTTVPASLPVVLTYDGSPTAPTALGRYAVVATVNDNNYQGTASGTLLISDTPPVGTLRAMPGMTADITPKALTITGLTGNNKLYDGNSSAMVSGTATLIGVVGTDDVTLTGTPVFTFGSADVGTAVAIMTTGYALTGADAGNYTLTQPTLSADITPQALTITGLTGNNKLYDGNSSAMVSGTAALSGVAVGDNVSLTGTPVFTFGSADVGTAVAITTTGYTLTGANAGNYTLTQPSLSANITTKALTITGLTGDDKPFDGTTNATATGTAALIGVVGTDEVTLSGTPVYTFSSANVGTAVAITTTGYTLTGAKARNYTLRQPSLSATIFEDPLFANPEGLSITLLPGGVARLTFEGIPGRTYAILCSRTMLPGSWTQISTVTVGENSQVIFDDTQAPMPCAFYRIALPTQ
jgi:hypothetical protein